MLTARKKRVRDILGDGLEVPAELDDERKAEIEVAILAGIKNIRNQELEVEVEPQPGIRLLAERSGVAREVAIKSRAGVEAEVETANAIEVAERLLSGTKCERFQNSV